MPDGGMLQIFRATNRYLTVTGRIFEGNDGKFKSLDRIIDHIQAAQPPKPKRKPGPAGERPWSPEREAELRAAIMVLCADDRGVWFRYGGALYDLEWWDGDRDVGREIWDAWSSTSDKFDPVVQDRVWNGFGNRAGDAGNTTVASIFRDARDAGWKAPKRTIDATGMSLEEVTLPNWNFNPMGNSSSSSSTLAPGISQAEQNKIRHALQGDRTEIPPYLGIPNADPEVRDRIGKILRARGGDTLKPAAQSIRPLSFTPYRLWRRPMVRPMISDNELQAPAAESRRSIDRHCTVLLDDFGHAEQKELRVATANSLRSPYTEKLAFLPNP
jgi:hypothetical protein